MFTVISDNHKAVFINTRYIFALTH